MNAQIEYRLRPVTRWIVTRYETELPQDGVTSKGTSSQHGEFDNADTAYAVGYALAAAEHQRLGYPPGDMRVQYPEPIEALGRLSEAVVFAEINQPRAEPSAPGLSLADLPYATAAALRRQARASGDLHFLAVLDREQVAIDA